jgi:hypothetical protein
MKILSIPIQIICVAVLIVYLAIVHITNVITGVIDEYT